jgi:hypothetical protein
MTSLVSIRGFCHASITLPVRPDLRVAPSAETPDATRGAARTLLRPRNKKGNSMSRIVLALALASGAVFAAGCSSEAKKGDPKVGGTIDPRLKPAESGSGGQPQGSKGKGAVKGD